MTVTPQITVSEGRLAVRGRTVLTGVPENVTAAHASGAGLVDGAFAGEPKSHHVFTFGTLRDCRFMCLFRFKLWWMTQRMGSSGRDVPMETQFMLIEVPASAGGDGHDGAGAGAGEPVYVVMLPLLEGQFRAALQGNDDDELQICIESGDKAVQTEQGVNMVYLHAGTNPFDTITQAVKAVEKHLQTFHHRDKKKQGLHSLAAGGAPPRFLIIDDGWQQIGTDSDETSKPAVAVQEGAQFASRLTGIKENSKFHPNDSGLKNLVTQVKRTQGVRQVYVWHAMAGYWGGVSPSPSEMSRYEAALAFPIQSPGVTANQPDIVMDSLSVLGLGLVHPRRVHTFYGELHAYLATCGVDGVKVDVQSIIETLGAGHGGRVALTRAYTRALEASVARSFPDNGCVSCMCHNTDMLYSSRNTAVVRASDDFYPRDPASHTVHVASVAYNSVFLGEFMQPDWDMFHSLHPAAEYHGAARAIGGCAIYVSDKPGNHDFNLLKKLVLPDGSVLRARLPGRPTRDCLFSDPARDGATLLKIWNLNKFGGVVGVFNCQGAGWCRVAKKTRVHDASPGTLTAAVRAADVDAISAAAAAEWTGDAVAYAHCAGELVRLPRGAAIPVTLGALQYEIFHFCPVRVIAIAGVEFAPIGLIDMFNAGGAVEECDVIGDVDSGGGGVEMRVRGCGRFGAYLSRRPARCEVDGDEVDFAYDDDTGLVAVELPVPEKEMYMWKIWNLNKFGGVVRVFNCQGARWCRVAKKTRVHNASLGTLTAAVRTADVDTISVAAGEEWRGDAVVYVHRSGELVHLPPGAAIPVTLGALQYEVFHFCPLRAIPLASVEFAPIGLINMFNAGGAVEECDVTVGGGIVEMRVRAIWGVFIEEASEVEFAYDGETGLVVVELPVPEKEMYMWKVGIRVYAGWLAGCHVAVAGMVIKLCITARQLGDEVQILKAVNDELQSICLELEEFKDQAEVELDLSLRLKMNKTALPLAVVGFVAGDLFSLNAGSSFQRQA
uniref:galactinol--sucrose galactosyltransferase n=1 Tax=Leersia perrieri TaxID=77586 RepID=A0A0D9WWR5_9ORYZ